MTKECIVGLGGKELSVRYDTFDDYMLDIFQEGINNL